jgi:DNA segregation ATPase FtsK/SpoIIIE-like protein
VRQAGLAKSELLRTLVLGLVTTHSSAALNLVRVDFKGGATFAERSRCVCLGGWSLVATVNNQRYSSS